MRAANPGRPRSGAFDRRRVISEPATTTGRPHQRLCSSVPPPPPPPPSSSSLPVSHYLVRRSTEVRTARQSLQRLSPDLSRSLGRSKITSAAPAAARGGDAGRYHGDESVTGGDGRAAPAAALSFIPSSPLLPPPPSEP